MFCLIPVLSPCFPSGNCMISYSNYRNIFPIWALGRYMNYVKKRKAQGLSN